MYPVSAAYLEAIQSRSVETRWFGNIHTKIGMLYDFDAASIVEGSGKVTRQICAGSDIQIGTTCSAQLDLSLRIAGLDRYALLDAEVKLYFQLLTQTGWETVPLGVFTVTDPPTRSLDVITLHAYDDMQKLDKPFGATLTGQPYSLLTFACNACGVELGTTQEEIANFTNGTVETYTYSEVQIYTYRDLVGYIAAYLCCFAFIGPDGKLYLKQYGMTPVRTISESWRFDYKPQDFEAFYTSLEAFFAVVEETETVTLGGSGLTYELGTNPLIQFNSDDVRRAVLTAILTRLAEAVYTPFEASVPCDPALMVGDVLNFTGNHAVDGKLSAITKQVISINRKMELRCAGSDPLISVKTGREKQLSTIAKGNDKAGMYYYDFVNAEACQIEDGRNARVILLRYITKQETHVDFHAEIQCQVETTESYDEETDTYTEHDGVLHVTYRSGDAVVSDHFPVDAFSDGAHLLHLLRTWWASANIISNFEVWIRCEGCSVTIAQAAARGYIAGVGLEGDGAWDGTVHIEDSVPLLDFGIIRKPFTAAAAVQSLTPLAPAASERVPRRNFFTTVFKRFAEHIGSSKLHRFSVAYNWTDMTYNNAKASGDVWVVDDPANLGMVITPDCPVTGIVKITSRCSGNDVAFLTSFDGGTTWWTFVNGWTAPDYTQDLYGMFETTLRSITPEQWAEKLDGTIMVQALLIENARLSDIQIYTEVTQE